MMVCLVLKSFFCLLLLNWNEQKNKAGQAYHFLDVNQNLEIGCFHQSRTDQGMHGDLLQGMAKIGFSDRILATHGVFLVK